MIPGVYRADFGKTVFTVCFAPVSNVRDESNMNQTFTVLSFMYFPVFARRQSRYFFKDTGKMRRRGETGKNPGGCLAGTPEEAFCFLRCSVRSEISQNFTSEIFIEIPEKPRLFGKKLIQ